MLLNVNMQKVKYFIKISKIKIELRETYFVIEGDYVNIT